MCVLVVFRLPLILAEKWPGILDFGKHPKINVSDNPHLLMPVPGNKISS